jgi:DNA-nicking Smr family endonuclease
MDFGEVLDEWEKIKREHKDSSPAPAQKEASAKNGIVNKPAPVKKASTARSVLESWLSLNDISDKDAEAEAPRSSAELSRESRRLAALKVQAVLDLHGMTAEEAESAIDAFVEASSRAGLEKILLIHGKGLHSSGFPVLKKAARRALESHPLAGRFGEADKADGGSGALWVLIRGRH